MERAPSASRLRTRLIPDGILRLRGPRFPDQPRQCAAFGSIRSPYTSRARCRVRPLRSADEPACPLQRVGPDRFGEQSEVAFAGHRRLGGIGVVELVVGSLPGWLRALTWPDWRETGQCEFIWFLLDDKS